jgi:hypothetical protein
LQLIFGLQSDSFYSGIPDPATDTVSVNSTYEMLSGLDSTCAFAVKLIGRAHVTNGRNRYIFKDENLQAITIEKCD